MEVVVMVMEFLYYNEWSFFRFDFSSRQIISGVYYVVWASKQTRITWLLNWYFPGKCEVSQTAPLHTFSFLKIWDVKSFLLSFLTLIYMGFLGVRFALRNGAITSSLKIVRIMLETWSLVGTNTHICCLRRYTC